MSDRVRFSVFMLVIFIPFLGFFSNAGDKSSTQEKRDLAELPMLPARPSELPAYASNFSLFFSDRLGARLHYVKLYHAARYAIHDSPSEKVVIGQGGFLFYAGDNDPVGDARNAFVYSDSELEEVAAYYAELSAAFRRRGAHYILVVAPNKHSIYPELLPSYVTKVNGKSALDQLIEVLHQAHVDVVDLRPALIKAKALADVYSPIGTHWNDFGASVAHAVLMHEASRRLPEIQVKPIPYDEFDWNHRVKDAGLAEMVGLAEVIKRRGPELKNSDLCMGEEKLVSVSNSAKGVTRIYCPSGKGKALIFRDSFFIALEPFISRYFAESTYVWKWVSADDVEYMLSYVEELKPDIVIEEWVERRLPIKNRVPAVLQAEHANAACAAKTLRNFLADPTDAFQSANVALERGLEGQLVLNATVYDPIVYLPAFMPAGPAFCIEIAIESTVDTDLAMYFAKTGAQGYPFSGESSRTIAIKKGKNTVLLPVRMQDFGGRLRLDPGRGPGRYEVSTLRILESTPE